MPVSHTWQKALFFILLASCLTPWVSPPLALFVGLILGLFVGNPLPLLTQKTTKWLLQLSVIGLGFGMNAHNALAIGRDGFMIASMTILLTLGLGLLIGKWMGIDTKTSYLIAAGTAICGGSAIAAVSPVIKAEERQISVSLATVFVLNAIALFIFPTMGHWLDMSQTDFGWWSAIAIHDTSSVVGAAKQYGQEALEIATTVKLSRALWIIPISLITAVIFKGSSKKIQIPYFIGLFVLAMLANTYVPTVSLVGPYMVEAAKAGLTATLFLIGSGLSLDKIKQTGIKPMLQGIVLWVFISLLTLGMIMLQH